MSGFVMDCSVTIAWCFEDETNAYTDAILQRLATEEAIVPSLWPLEVANVLLVGERRKRLTPAETSQFLRLLSALPIIIDEQTPHRVFRDTLPLARTHSLSSYDAAYLELAMRLGLPLASQDEKLKQAAVHLGLVVL